MKRFFLLALTLITTNSAWAQLANWSGYKSTKFPTNVSGQIHGQARISQMKFHATSPNKMYAITPQGGLFITTDAATSWTVAPGTDALTAKLASVCIDYTNDQIIYLGGGDPNYWGSGAGAFKSTNGGATFSQLTGGLPTTRIVSEIIMHPTDPNTLVASTNGGIYKTTDAGVTWTAKTSTSLQFCSMKSNTAANSLILYATTQTATPEFYRSTDFGDTWTLITAGLSNPTVAPLQTGSRVAVTLADPNVVYFAMVASGGILFKSTDGGLTFTQTKAGGSPYLTFYTDDIADSGQGNYNFTIGVDNVDANKVWLQSHNTWYSSNSGSTWTMLTFWASKVHTDMHQIGKSPYDNTKLYSCNDGGVWLSTDEGNNWTPKSDGIYAFEIGDNTGKSSPTRKDFISIGTQDNGGLYADSTGWYTITGGDDYTKREIDQRANSAAVYYVGSTETQRRLAPASGSTTYGIPTAGIEAIAFNRTNTNLAFMGSSNIYRSTDVQNATPAWTQISTFSKTIMSIHSCIADPNRLYVLTSDQKIYVSTNALSATPTFTPYNLPSASSSIATVTAICNNANTVYISVNNKVYRSADGGQTWTNISYNLPSVNHRRILSEAYYGTEELVFVATNNAVYYKKASQTTWTNYSTNLPPRQAPTELSIYDDGTNKAVIRYASYGRGVWETPFENVRTTNAVVTASNSNICSDATWNYADVSTGVIVSRVWSFPGGTPSSSTAPNPSVTYATTGTYTATLTVTDANSNTAATTYQVMVNDLNKCDADTIPGNALQLLASTDYATMSAPLNITTNTITFSAWIKPNGVQSSTTGLIFSGSNGATGINLRSNNRLSYHWNDEAGSYSYNGPTVPSDVWSHIAVVITPTNATFYLNGVPSVRTATHIAVNFNSAFNIGNDRGNTSRTFKGLMDEVCIYNRSLSTNEVRELMHLTKVPTADASLLAYYQMNEPNGTVLFNHAGSNHAYLQAGATRATSTAPVGGGVSERQAVTTGGLKSFNTPGVALEFPATGIYPNGDVVVTRLNVAPDQKPTSTIVPNNGYFIVNNFGTNSAFSTLSNIRFNNLPGIATGYNTTDFGFYKRSSIADGNTWGSAVDQADVFTPNGQNSSLTFSTGNNITSFSQFVITPTYATAGADVVICSGNSTTLGSANNPALTYSWSPGTSLSSTTISNPIASPTTNTTYTVTVTEIASGNTFTDEVVVSIAAPFVSAASIVANPVSATVCAGGSVSLTGSGGTAPTYIELGTGTLTTTGNSTGSALGPNPLQNYYGGSKQLMLFTAAELRSFGLIAGAQLSGFGVNLAVSTTYVLNNLQIKVQHTNLTVLSSFVTSGWTIVRNPANYTPVTGWNTIPFNTNFTWDGSSNLLVEVNYSNNNNGSSGNTALYGTASTVNTLFYREDGVTAAAMDTYSGAPSYTYAARNNVRFSIAGTTSYTWLPTTGLNTATGANVTATPSTSTTYVLSASFAGSCPAKASQVVTVNPNPTLSLTPSCVSGPGTGVLTPTFTSGAGGTPTYNPSTLTALANGTYTVTVTEAPSACSATASATINCVTACPDLTAAAPVAIVSSQSLCSNCTLSGGVIAAPSTTCPVGSTLQYSTNGGANWSTTLPTYNQTTALTVLTRCNCDANNATSSPTSSVTTVPGVCTPVTATATPMQPSCGLSNGSISVTPTGGTYAWTGGLSGENPTNVAAGTYTVTVTLGGCSATASATLNTSSALTATATPTQPSCGLSNGSISVTPTGGTYAWTGGLSGENPTNVAAGTYTVTVTLGGCSATASATLNTSSALTATATPTQPSCGLSNGSISVTPTGGTYTWTGGLSGENPTNIAAGTYTVTVTSGGCSATTSATLNTSTALTATATPTQPSCGLSNGSISVTPTGGTYAWTGGLSGENPTNVAAGTYTVTVTSGGCSSTASVTLNTSTALTATATPTQPSCGLSNGSISVTPTGGTYAWTGGLSGENPTNVASGAYTVTVTSGGCSSTASVTLNTSTALTATATPTQPSCGLSNGSISVTPTGATYTWTGGLSGENPTNVASGTYTVTVTLGGCSSTASVTLNTSTALTATATPTQPSCGLSNGSISVTPTGGTYAWTGGLSGENPTNVASGTYTVTVTLGGCSATASITLVAVSATPTASNTSPACVGSTITLNVNPNTPMGLTATAYAWSGPAGTASVQNPSIKNMTIAKAGIYTVTVTYSNGCTATATTNVTLNASPAISSVVPSCVSGVGRITVNATGTGLTYNIGSGSQSSNVFNSVSNGTYTVTVTNTSGCTATAIVVVNCATCPVPIASNNSPVCTGGTINLMVNPNLPMGITATYLWSGPGGTATLQNPTLNNATIVKAGVYTVTVTYSNGCISTSSTTVALAPSLSGTISGASSFCVGGSTVLTAIGGGTYLWSTGATTAAITVTTAGTYAVTITNGTACKRISKTLTTTTCKNQDGYLMPETLLVTPNPFATRATVEFMTNSTGNTRINVYGIEGRQVANLYNANTQAGETYQVTLDGANLPSGMYFVEMTNANGKRTLVKVMISY